MLFPVFKVTLAAFTDAVSLFVKNLAAVEETSVTNILTHLLRAWSST